MMKDKRVSSKDVAREAGVSQATVSYVLNQNPNVKIRPETRQAVLDAARRLNYHVDYIARNMRLGKSSSVAIVSNSNMPSYIFLRILEGIKSSLKDRNYSLTVSFANYTDIRDAEFIKSYYSNLVDGIVFVFCDLTEQDTDFLEEHQIPYVTINANYQPHGRHQIKTDLHPAMSDAVAQLKAAGHTSIGYIGQFAGDEKAMRYSAYRAAMREHKMRVQSRYVYKISGDESLMESAIAAQLDPVLADGKLPHVLLCDSILAGFYVQRYLHKNHISMPDKIALVVIGSNDFCKRVYPTLSAVEAPLHAIGFRGSEFLFDIMESEGKTPADSIVLKWQFIRRESC